MSILPQWVTSTAARMLGATAPSAVLPSGERREPWFGPGQPMRAIAPERDVAGRAYDYPNQVNMGTTPRQYEGVSFAVLRDLAESLDIVRLCIETRKDQMSKLTGSVLPMQEAGERKRKKADDRCKEVNRFMRFPDRRHDFVTWQRMVLDEQMITDAVSLYVRKTVAGKPYAIEQVDGANIKPILDVTGRQPEAPLPAYQHILKGMPAINYTADELIYAPRNPRVHCAYGMSNVQQIVTTINIAVRREIVKLEYFSSGNIPEALISVPPDWTPDQIERFQKMWNALMADASARAGAKFVPGNMTFQPTRNDAMLMGPFDEWIARVVCFCFSLPPTAFVQQLNRNTAESAQDAALEEGLAPMMLWMKALIDRIIQQVFAYDDLEWVWDDVKSVDPDVEQARDLGEMQAGLVSLDSLLIKRGEDPIGMGHAIWGGPNGVIFLDDLIRAHAQGLTAIQPPMQTDEFGNPIPSMPAMGPGGMPGEAPATAPGLEGVIPQTLGAPAPQRLLAAPRPPGLLDGIPAHILQSVGLGPDGVTGRAHDVTQADAVDTDPLAAAAPNPGVRAALRDAEARQQKE